MSEELRFFLRTALYTVLVASIYWFVSYEWAGTFLLGALGLSAIVFVIVMGTKVPRARRFPERPSPSLTDTTPSTETPAPDEPPPHEPVPTDAPLPETPIRGRIHPSRVSRFGAAGVILRRNVGFADHPDDEAGGPMELEEDLFPTASIWPVVLAVACTLIGLGLVFGPWLWVPGAGIGLAAGISWLTQLAP